MLPDCGLVSVIIPTQNAEKSSGGLVQRAASYADDRVRFLFTGGVFDRHLESERKRGNGAVSRLGLSEAAYTRWLNSRTTLIPRRIRELGGGFYEPFFIWSDERDYSLRVREAGYRLVIVAGSRVYHKVGCSLRIMKPLAYCYGTRNRLLRKKMHLSLTSRLLFLLSFALSRIPRYGQLAAQGR